MCLCVCVVHVTGLWLQTAQSLLFSVDSACADAPASLWCKTIIRNFFANYFCLYTMNGAELTLCNVCSVLISSVNF